MEQLLGTTATTKAPDGSRRRLLDGYLDRKQLADELGITQRTISRWQAQPDGIPSTSVGGRTLFKIESVLAWIDAREKRPNQRRRVA